MVEFMEMFQMLGKIKMLILKITFSPIWFAVVLSYVFIETWERFANPTGVDEEVDIWEYWRL